MIFVYVNIFLDICFLPHHPTEAAITNCLIMGWITRHCLDDIYRDREELSTPAQSPTNDSSVDMPAAVATMAAVTSQLQQELAMTLASQEAMCR